MLRKLNNGELLSRTEVEYIANNFKVSRHAKQRLSERLCKNVTDEILKELISSSKFAYYNTDNSINLAISEYKYFIFGFNLTMINFKDRSRNNVTIYDKQKLAKKGIKRVYQPV